MSLKDALNRAAILAGKTCSAGSTLRQSEADCITLAAKILDLECQRDALDESYTEARAALAAKTAEASNLASTLARVLIAIQRYESRHDRDPERKKLWAEVKAAFVTETAAIASPATEAK